MYANGIYAKKNITYVQIWDGRNPNIVIWSVMHCKNAVNCVTSAAVGVQKKGELKIDGS